MIGSRTRPCQRCASPPCACCSHLGLVEMLRHRARRARLAQGGGRRFMVGKGLQCQTWRPLLELEAVLGQVAPLPPAQAPAEEVSEMVTVTLRQKTMMTLPFARRRAASRQPSAQWSILLQGGRRQRKELVQWTRLMMFQEQIEASPCHLAQSISLTSSVQPCTLRWP